MALSILQISPWSQKSHDTVILDISAQNDRSVTASAGSINKMNI